ncbi:hematopoietic SH2 domain-containing protein homolog [Etheostoma spectabile]|uniref:hematopoietic SH2 domain-containing protein homolog n=1 Tax=Etheostoma spectabile TaxID=54343 RepID=UPI0013AF5EA3|nr:hematopoietic SH2 domain-containing protein [Etheostoma spectabile]XP_032381113.1 hematopoietic SH2 domain-containing protein [Etheostoma spectabile]
MMESSQSSQEQRDAFIWFTESQLQVVIRNGIVPEWFHGIISRKMAEELLMPKPPGYFLIRVSESRIGYTLSYRAEDRCRHFMIDALEDGHYVIVGENRHHRFLQDLVDFHRRTPIFPFTEVLTVACGQTSKDKTDYAELLFPQRHLNPNTSLLPNNSLPPSTSQQTSQEDIPPALPYRPNNLKNSPVPSSNKLYPSLEEEFLRVTSPLPVPPVTRKRNTGNSPPSNQPPEVPDRSSVPPLKQNQACIRTVSAPESPPTPTATGQPSNTNIQSVKNQEAKLSVISNLKNLKKKFQKKKSISQENMYAEINVAEPERSGNSENEYHEITGQQTFNAPPFPHTCTELTLTDGGVPHEYLPPPPFAPGY